MLGPQRGQRPAQAAIWDHTVSAIGQHRELWNITDDECLLGPKPHHYNDPRRHDWQDAAHILAQAGRQLGRDHDFDHQLQRDLGLDHGGRTGISR